MKKAVVAFLLFFLAQVVSSACALLAVNAENLLGGGRLDVSLLAERPVYSGVALLCCDVVLLFLLWALRLLPARSFALPCRRVVLAWGLPLAATLLLSVGETLLLSPLGLSDNGSLAIFSAMKGNAWCLLLFCVAGPLTEEVVFRGGVLGNLRLSGLSPWAALGVSAALFAVVHGNWAQALPAAAGGVVFGLFYLRTGSLAVPVFAHVANNTLAVVSLFHPEAEFALAAQPLAAQLVLGALCVAACAGIVAFWWKKLKPLCA